MGLGVGAGMRVEVGGGWGLTWTEASLLWQLSKPRVRNTPSRTATVDADTSELRSVRATLGPCKPYFPWGGKARVGLGWGSAESQEWAGPGSASHYLSFQTLSSICHLRGHLQGPSHQEGHGGRVGASSEHRAKLLTLVPMPWVTVLALALSPGLSALFMS